MEFEWDDVKADSNYKKHGIHFSEAVSVWADGFALEMSDPEHSDNEDRWIRLGVSNKARLLVVVYCERAEGNRVRIISARTSTKNENKQYNGSVR